MMGTMWCQDSIPSLASPECTALSPFFPCVPTDRLFLHHRFSFLFFCLWLSNLCLSLCLSCSLFLPTPSSPSLGRPQRYPKYRDFDEDPKTLQPLAESKSPAEHPATQPLPPQDTISTLGLSWLSPPTSRGFLLAASLDSRNRRLESPDREIPPRPRTHFQLLHCSCLR